MQVRFLVAAMFAMLLAACNPMAQLDDSEAAITKFHETYNTGDARALYGLTSAEFREATPAKDMVALVESVSERMGAVQSSEREGVNLNTNNGLTITTITMKTQFEKGEGIETFTFHGTGDDLRLVGWNIDSPNFADIPEDAVTVVDNDPAAEE